MLVDYESRLPYSGDSVSEQQELQRFFIFYYKTQSRSRNNIHTNHFATID
jgi:hypothetical protein